MWPTWGQVCQLGGGGKFAILGVGAKDKGTFARGRYCKNKQSLVSTLFFLSRFLCFLYPIPLFEQKMIFVMPRDA